jgi:hypothetical protein
MLIEFECKKCRGVYEELVKYDPKGKYKGVKCPYCSSVKKIRLISQFQHNFTKPEGTKKYNASHELRYKYALEKPGGAIEQRMNAERLSHMGKEPYLPIDDISSGKYFGKVK